MKRNAILRFGRDLVDKPILSNLIRKHNVDVNILQASITADEDGEMFVQVEGDSSNVKKAIDHLKDVGVKLTFPATNVIWEENRCTHCGACVAHCLPKALFTDNVSKKISFNADKCIACELCIPACPFGAIESVTERL